ncbi:hypothetical protein, partial [Mesorhizobium sp. Cs1299R1N3]|uniref:hypothetical protein n=1 Tax=Mesorhizobium sp. Cs1299R1N3 TaxID=3015173 RepID=UPI00301D005A
TGWRPTDTSIWTICASTKNSLYAKPHDQHHGRPILQNLTHTTRIYINRDLGADRTCKHREKEMSSVAEVRVERPASEIAAEALLLPFPSFPLDRF